MTYMVCDMQGEPWVSYGVGKCQLLACRFAPRPALEYLACPACPCQLPSFDTPI